MIKVSVVTKEKLIYEGDVKEIIAPAYDGYLGVLANHAPMLCILKEGELSLFASSAEQENQVFHIKSGVLEVQDNKASLLVNLREDTH